MPLLSSREVAVTLDMAGCPNRCRHCWVGNHPNIHMSEKTLRWVINQYREYVHPTASTPFFDQIIVQTWYRGRKVWSTGLYATVYKFDLIRRWLRLWGEEYRRFC